MFDALLRFCKLRGNKAYGTCLWCLIKSHFQARTSSKQKQSLSIKLQDTNLQGGTGCMAVVRYEKIVQKISAYESSIGLILPNNF